MRTSRLPVLRLFAVLLLSCLPVWGEDYSGEFAFQDIGTASEALFSESIQAEPIQTDLGSDIEVTQSALPKTNWQFGADYLIYQPNYDSVTFQSADGDDNFMDGLRFNLGWESDSGFGLRARVSNMGVEGMTGDSAAFTDFQDIPVNGTLIPSFFAAGGYSTLRGFDFPGVSPLSTVSSAPLEFNAGTFDLDFYKRFQYRGLNVLLGAGLSSAGLSIDIPSVVDNTILAGGASLFSEGRYVMFASEVSELALVGGGRVAFLDGEWEVKRDSGMGERDTDLTITEARAGLEWKRQLGKTVLTLRAQYEYQLWNSDVTSDLVLNGAALRAGLSW